MSQAEFERAKNDSEQVLGEVLQNRSKVDALSNFDKHLSQYELTVEEREQLVNKFQMDLQENGVDVAACLTQDSDLESVCGFISPGVGIIPPQAPLGIPQVALEIPPYKNDDPDEQDDQS